MEIKTQSKVRVEQSKNRTDRGLALQIQASTQTHSKGHSEVDTGDESRVGGGGVRGGEEGGHKNNY